MRIYLRFIFLCEKSENLTDKNLKKNATKFFQCSSDFVIVMNIELCIVRCVIENDTDVKHKICTFAKEHSRNTSSVKSTATLDVSIAMWCWIETSECMRCEWLKHIESKQPECWRQTNQHIKFTHTNLKKWSRNIWKKFRDLQKKKIKLNICLDIFALYQSKRSACRKRKRKTFDDLECISHSESLVVIRPTDCDHFIW